jgi:hypothetical protein
MWRRKLVCLFPSAEGTKPSLSSCLIAAQNDIVTKQQEIDNLKKQLQTIKDAQISLDTISTTDVPNMRTQLGMFNQVWLAAVSDCEQIIQWIEQGEKVVVSDGLPLFSP